MTSKKTHKIGEKGKRNKGKGCLGSSFSRMGNMKTTIHKRARHLQQKAGSTQNLMLSTSTCRSEEMRRKFARAFQKKTKMGPETREQWGNGL